jgi:hypothetical protein
MAAALGRTVLASLTVEDLPIFAARASTIFKRWLAKRAEC